MAKDPFELLTKSQAAAVRLAGDALRTIRNTAVTGVTAPDELVVQVANLASGLTGIAAATAQPLQDFIVRQRELAETVAALAEAQSQLADVVATLAERHAEAVTALEQVTAPVLGLMGADTVKTARKAERRASRKTPPGA
jgi:hypothetical protein